MYNAESSISNAMESVLHQETLPYEVLLIDDASTDGTCQVVEDWIEKYEKGPGSMIFSLLQLVANGGPAVARNHGVQAAQGDYVAFLDSDDRWMPHHLDVLIEGLMEHPDVSLVCSEMEGIDATYSSSLHDDNVGWRRVDLSEFVWGNPVRTSVVVVSAATFRSVGEFDER